MNDHAGTRTGAVPAQSGRHHRATAIVAATAASVGLVLRWAALFWFRHQADAEFPLNRFAFTFVPGELFVLSCIIGCAAAAWKRHVSAFVFAALAIGASLYGSVLASSGMLADLRLWHSIAWQTLAWPAFAAAIYASTVLHQRFQRATAPLGLLPGAPTYAPIAQAAAFVLGSYALAWSVFINFGKYKFLGGFHPKYAYAADALLIAALAGMYAGLGLRRVSGYLLGLAACGALVYRSLHVVTSLRTGCLTQYTTVKLISWPYLVVGLVGGVRLGSEFRAQIAHLVAQPAAAPMGLSARPIIPSRLAELLRQLFNASGIPALVRAWNRLWVHGIWRVAKGEKVHTWSQVIFGAQGHAEDLFLDAATFIEGTHVPDVRMRRNNVTPGIVRGLFGVRREFLTVTPVGNARLERYCMYLGARDYGDALDVYWYVVQRPAWWERLLVILAFVPVVNLIVLPILLVRLVRERRGSLDLDFFDESDLSACVTVAHHGVQEAVKKLMISLNQDPNKLVTTTKGFLGIA